MKFKLVENYKITRRAIQEYAHDAIEELGNASLEEYIQWFSELSEYFDDEVKQAVKDFYIEAIDCGKIDQPKTMITSELTTYLESNSELIDKDIDELIDNCPAHLKHELKIVLSKLDESLNEELLTESTEDHKFIYEARFKTNDGEYELFTDDYNKFSNIIYDYYQGERCSDVFIHVLELSLNPTNEVKFIDKKLKAPEKSMIKIIKDSSANIQSFNDVLDVVKFPWRRTAEENKILSDKPLIDANRLLHLWKELHDSNYNIKQLNADFMEIEVRPENKKNFKT